MGTFLVLDIPKVPSDSTIWELRKSIFGIFGIKNLSRLDSRDMCIIYEYQWWHYLNGIGPDLLPRSKSINFFDFSTHHARVRVFHKIVTVCLSGEISYIIVSLHTIHFSTL